MYIAACSLGLRLAVCGIHNEGTQVAGGQNDLSKIRKDSFARSL